MLIGLSSLFSMILLILIITDVFILKSALKTKKWTLFIVITSIIVISILLLGYLWITSPM